MRFPKEDASTLERLVRRLALTVSGYPYDLALASRLSGLLEKRAADLAHEALRPLQLTYVLYQTMMIILGGENGFIAPTEIAHLTGERPSNVTHICNELVIRHLITRTYAAAKDKRRVKIALTAEGQRLLEKAQPLIWAGWTRRFDGFDPVGMKLGTSCIRRQLENMGSKLDARE